jgi:hypothetical protein
MSNSDFIKNPPHPCTMFGLDDRVVILMGNFQLGYAVLLFDMATQDLKRFLPFDNKTCRSKT